MGVEGCASASISCFLVPSVVTMRIQNPVFPSCFPASWLPSLLPLCASGHGRNDPYERPPHRSQRAVLPHWAPTSGNNVQSLAGIWMQNSGSW